MLITIKKSCGYALCYTLNNHLHIYVDADGELEDINLDDAYSNEHMDIIVDQRSNLHDKKGMCIV